MTTSSGRGDPGALWLVHGWVSDSGGEAAQTGTISCGRDPVESPLEDPTRPMDTPGLSDPSGSCLRVRSHDVMGVISRDIYSGLYLGRVSLDMAHSHTFVLTFFDGITTRAVAVDLHFFAGSYNGSV